jgi:protoheme IX farnesyltransferase
LKRKTHYNTEIGAVAGAMPIIMGSLATTQTVGLIGWAFFGVLFLWQFPHFMAIAWMYRDQYRQGGLKMLTVTDPTGAAAGQKSIVTGVLLIAVSLLPVLGMRTTVHAWLFAVVAIFLGAYYLKAAIAFSRTTTDPVARRLLRVSLLYLPLYMLALIVTCLT